MKDSKKGLVSVIICLFNVSKFLEGKMLSCILNQTWRDLEIILVNDGSTDRTPEICKTLAEKDSRIVLVEKTNGGLGSARNAGLDMAKGDYLWFYDVDDEVELDLVEKNVQWMRDNNTDMNIFGQWFIYPDTGRTEVSHFKNRLLASNGALKDVFVDDLFLVPNGNGFVCNKFYRRDFVNQCGVRFGEQRIQQDELFNLKLYPHAEMVYVSSELLYHYFIYNSGNNRSRYIPDRIAVYESIFDGINHFRNSWPIPDNRLEDYAYKRFYQGIETTVLFNTFHPDAPSSCRWKKQEVHAVLTRPSVRRCLEYLGHHHQFNLEGRLFFRAYDTCNFILIYILKCIFGFLRKVKHTIIPYRVK